MNTPANDNRIETTERKVDILQHMIAQMQEDLGDAEGKRKAALLQLIRMGEERLRELRTLH